MRRHVLNLLGIAAFVVLGLSPVLAQDRSELIGAQPVGFEADEDVFEIGRDAGPFESLSIGARNNDVIVLDVRVVYGNGQADDLDVRGLVRDGERTRPIDLKGRDRDIREVRIISRARPTSRRRAVVELYGEEAPRQRWELIGSDAISPGFDRTNIEIDSREGRFERLRLTARRGDVFVGDIRVTYGNGEIEDIELSQLLREGDESRPIDLGARGRFIQSVELTTRSRPRPRAIIDIYGEQGRGRPREPEANWVELGCQKVGLFGDRDTIRVGRQEGRFRAIKLKVSGNSVYMMDLSVVYGRGPADDIQVRSELREGSETRPIDLRGERRSIERIEMLYRAKPNFRGSARVCALGLEDRSRDWRRERDDRR